MPVRVVGIEFRLDTIINTTVLALVFMFSTRMIIKQLKQNALENQTGRVELITRIDKVIQADQRLVDKVIVVQAEEEALKQQEDANIVKLQKIADLMQKRREAQQ